MRQSKLFLKTKREAPRDAIAISHKFLVRADFIEQTISGVFRFLPLGYRVLKKIEQIIREEMLALGSQELSLPALQDKKLWLETGRWETIDPPLFKLKDRHQKETALGSTHEEEVSDLVRKRTNSYQDLPFSLFQIQTKFRNEMRATGGLLRVMEFLMKDLYSFHCDEKDLVLFYNKVKNSYFKIFKRCGLRSFCVQASSGTIGGKLSNEFMVLSEAGEDKILICKKCGYGANVEKAGDIEKCPVCRAPLEKKNAIEVGHIFNLEKKYSQPMKVFYKDKEGKEKPILMGCYGIGVTRLMATIVEVSHDQRGIIWPKEVAPFKVHLISLENNKKVKDRADKLYNNLQKEGIEVLYDDRDRSAGEKFYDSDLIGIPLRIVISPKTLIKNSVEMKKRDGKETKLVKIKDFPKKILKE